MCRLVNHYHGRNPFARQSGEPKFTQTFEAAIHVAKEKIAKLLGTFSWDEAEKHFGFSTGASTRLPRRSGHPFYKYQGKPDVTPNASVLGVVAMWRTAAWKQLQDCANPESWTRLVRGSRAFTVRKSAKEDRFACAEACLNMYLQRGIGMLFRLRLRRVGIDLNDQSYNQYLAACGSRTGAIATIDLASASDSVSLELVRALLPGDWFEALMLTRAEYVQLPSGDWHRLEKISSMGNGFTFELESLIFWALGSAILDLYEIEDRRFGVYGDDIAIHCDAAQPLIELLDYCGFRTNGNKTFLSGPFRESCGKHYFYGQDVTPFYIDEAVVGANRSNWLVNSFNMWAFQGHLDLDKCGRLLEYFVKKFKVRVTPVPGNLSSEAGIFVPSVEWSGCFWSFRKQRYLYKALAPVRRKHKPGGVWALLTWLALAPVNREEHFLLRLEKGELVYRSFNRSTSVWPGSNVRFVISFDGKAMPVVV
jgi:hypothetical protein